MTIRTNDLPRRVLPAMTPRLAAALTLLLLASAAQAQPDCAPCLQARADVDTLTSVRYAGRGYDTRQGAARAASFVARRFEALGLRPLGGTHQVPFGFAAKLVGTSGLAVNGRVLRMGEDVLPLTGSRSGSGMARVGTGPGRVSVLTAPDSLAVRVGRAAAQGAVAVVVLGEALPAYGGTGFTAPVPVFAVRRAAWPDGTPLVRYRMDAADAEPRVGVNVVGAVPGTAVPDSFLVVTAHYDHVGCFADAFSRADVCFPGANDNASGTAMLLALAGEVARRPLRYSVVFVAFGGEEQGLYGSRALAASPLWPLERTRFLVNLDMTASGAGVMAFGATDFGPEFARLAALASAQHLPSVIARETRPNSDHYPFVARGVRAFYLLTAGGTQPYHNVRDVPATLEWEAWERLYGLTSAFLQDLSGR
ncbi:MAG TPA: M28 family peptidase [Rhodothermales bacterium]|nr:M28 family peptidase [Rhodothermales bacterium]